MVKSFLHGHFLGMFLRGLSYLKQRASLNSDLFKLNPWSFSGMAPTQLEAPGADSCSRFLTILGCCLERRLLCFSWAISLSLMWVLDFASLTSSGLGRFGFWVSICFLSGSVMFFDAVYVWSEVWLKLRRPRPPSLIGSDKISLSFGDIAVPKRAGMSSCSMMLSKGWSMSDMLGIF